jgi:hypothetical protein
MMMMMSPGPCARYDAVIHATKMSTTTQQNEDWLGVLVEAFALDAFVAPRSVHRLVSTWLALYANDYGVNVTPGPNVAHFLERLGHLANPMASMEIAVHLVPPPLGDVRQPRARVPLSVSFFGGDDLSLTEAHLREHADTFGGILYTLLVLALDGGRSGVAAPFHHVRRETASGLVHMCAFARPDVVRAAVSPRYLVVVAITLFMRALSGVAAASRNDGVVRSILDHMVDALARLAVTYDDDGGHYGQLARALADPVPSFADLLASFEVTTRAWDEERAHAYEHAWKRLAKQHHVRFQSVDGAGEQQ